MSYKKTEKITGIKEIISSNGKCLIPIDRLLKCPPPEDEQGFKNFYRKAFNPDHWANDELDSMNADELRAKLAEIRETRARIGLPPFVSQDQTIDEIWQRKKQHRK